MREEKGRKRGEERENSWVDFWDVFKVVVFHVCVDRIPKTMHTSLPKKKKAINNVSEGARNPSLIISSAYFSFLPLAQ